MAPSATSTSPRVERTAAIALSCRAAMSLTWSLSSAEMLRRGGRRTSNTDPARAPGGMMARITRPSGVVKAASDPGPMPGGMRTRRWPGGTGCVPGPA